MTPDDRKPIDTSSNNVSNPQVSTPGAAAANKAPARPVGSPASAQGNTPVRVGRERKGRGGKTVSIITGVVGNETSRQVLLKLLKNKLGTGGALEEDNLVIQGDHRQRIVEILSDLGYKAKSAGG